MYEILKLNVQNSTPLFIGGYDTRACSEFHEEELRTQSIKGLWRWWLRAFLSGRYLLQDYTDIEAKVNDEVGKVLGFAGRKGSQSSRLALRFTKERSQVKVEPPKKIPRVKLLTLGREEEPNYIESITGTLSINLFSFQEREKSIESQNIRTAVLSLISGLLLSGIGKGGRRGLGCLDFKIVEDRVGLPESLKNWNSLEALRDVLREALSLERYKEIKSYPPIPSIAPGFFKLWYISFDNKKVEEVLIDLQEFTLRTKRRDIIPENNEDPFRVKHVAWILGLPRQVGSTGYLFKEAQRRASPLIFSVHRNFATACLFKSSDWPENIIWKGRSQESDITVKNIIVKKKLDLAYNLLESKFLEYMKEKKGYNVQEVKIW